MADAGYRGTILGGPRDGEVAHEYGPVLFMPERVRADDSSITFVEVAYDLQRDRDGRWWWVRRAPTAPPGAP